MATRRHHYEVPETAESYPLTSVTKPKGREPGHIVVNVPSHEGGAPFVNMHGEGPSPSSAHNHPYDVTTDLPPRSPAIDIVVFFADNTGIKFKVDDGANTEAGELFEMVLEEKRFSNIDLARQMFSLWLVSEFLELQLKPNHVPFKLVAFWEELLERYTCAKEEDREKDEPVIVFRRNVFYSKYSEQNIPYSKENMEMLRLLYHEAKENIIDGRYTTAGLQEEGANLLHPKIWFDRMAGMQAMLQHKNYDETIHTPAFYSASLQDFYPCHMRSKKWLTIDRNKEPNHRLARAHEAQFRAWGRVPISTDERLYRCYREYLAECWRLPYYGAAFFRGQIEHPGRFLSAFSSDDPVWIAVNTSGVYFIDMDNDIFLMGTCYCDKLKWNYAEPNELDNNKNKAPEHMPCIFFIFEDKETKTKEIYRKVLQVFSKEAKHIDALMDACDRLRKEMTKSGKRYDDVDGVVEAAGRGDGDFVIESDDKIWLDFNHRALTCFDKRGCVTRTKLRNVQTKQE